ncbi:MAG: HAMP domain-containing sensor histidine kinase [Brevundimonas sp.]|uniref:sensor histidine kinase n=1 Tax=Brevundimonas sp. TaxID=1871086 RepID=UPI0027359229|nr:HAMP domain-containing sensor histidine kinase [Brevundimonas sp.]MDP3405999.1 HAMP domain-containing sensor histidine kinase [Brevundimonas sp.]
MRPPPVDTTDLFDRVLARLRLPAGWRERLRPPTPDGLSSRLLILTAAFTLAVQALIMGPNAATFHETWLLDRLQAAELASVGVEALPYNAVDDDTAEQLLRIGGVSAVAISDQGVMRQLLQAPNLPRAPDFIDLRGRSAGARLLDPVRTLLGSPDRSIRVRSAPRYRSGDFIDVVAPAEPLKVELRGFLLNSLLVSLLISGVAGGLLYAGLAFLVLQPLRRVTRSIESFAADPQAPGPEPSNRNDEIGRVERELSRMQEEVRASLRSRARLVALGEAVAKINHDLRNMLTSAQIASERLASSADPQVAKALPRLERALGRAAALARNVLDYGRSEEPEPVLGRFALAPAAAAAGEDAGLESTGVRLVRSIPPRFALQADADQLHRILVNLMRNARQAIEADTARAPLRKGGPLGSIRLEAEARDGWCIIRIADDGPGIPARLSERLFEPFVSGSGSDGSGLGLTISRELAASHGGDLRLVHTGPTGTTFELRLPL